MILLRRLTVLITLMFWQGGFMFYGAVVVPVGAEVLGSHRVQGRVTRAVTNYLHAAGAVCLTAWCFEIVAAGGAQRRLRWTLLISLALTLAVQVWLHAWLEDLLDVEPLDSSRFGVLHQAYLIVSTAQWLTALVLLALTMRTWHTAPDS